MLVNVLPTSYPPTQLKTQVEARLLRSPKSHPQSQQQHKIFLLRMIFFLIFNDSVCFKYTHTRTQTFARTFHSTQT